MIKVTNDKKTVESLEAVNRVLDLDSPNFLGNEVEEKNQLLDAIKDFYDIKNGLSTKTDIGADTIKYLLKLTEYGKMVKDIDAQSGNEILEMIEEYKRLRISNSRQGRKEFKEMIMAVMGNQANQPKKSLFSRLFNNG